MTGDRLDQALDRLHQAERTAEPDLAAIRAKVLAAAAKRPSRQMTAAAVRRRRWLAGAAGRQRPVLWLAGAAALVLLIGSQVVSPSAPPATRSSTVTPSPVPRISLASATEFLNGAADLQIHAADQPLKPGQYRYVATHSYDSVSQQLDPSGGYSYLVERRQEVWIPADPAQQWVMRRSTPPTSPKWLGGSIPESQASPPTPTKTDSGEWRADCGAFFPSLDGKRPCEDPTDSSSAAFYQQVPRDPAQLVEFMAAQTRGHGSTPLAEFRYATNVLLDGVMPAELRAAWYRAMAMIPGVAITADQATVDGRVGVAIGLSDAEEHDDVIIDGGSGEFLGLRQLVGEHSQDFPWLRPGTLVESSSVSTKIVNGVG